MKTQTIATMCLSVLLAGIGCGCARVPLIKPEIAQDAQGNFTLYVSNQSFADDTVDIRVSIDGKVVLHEYFRVGNQHSWKPFTFQLAPGEHTIEAFARDGSVELTAAFEVQARKWAVLSYLHFPRNENPIPRSFTFSALDEPPMFM